MKSKMVRDLGRRQGSWIILLVCVHKEGNTSQFISLEQFSELCTCLSHTFPISRVDNVNQRIESFIIMSPQRSESVLTSNIPHGQSQILVLNSLDGEANGGDRCYNLQNPRNSDGGARGQRWLCMRWWSGWAGGGEGRRGEYPVPQPMDINFTLSTTITTKKEREKKRERAREKKHCETRDVRVEESTYVQGPSLIWRQIRSVVFLPLQDSNDE